MFRDHTRSPKGHAWSLCSLSLSLSSLNLFSIPSMKDSTQKEQFSEYEYSKCCFRCTPSSFYAPKPSFNTIHSLFLAYPRAFVPLTALLALMKFWLDQDSCPYPECLTKQPWQHFFILKALLLSVGMQIFGGRSIPLKRLQVGISRSRSSQIIAHAPPPPLDIVRRAGHQSHSQATNGQSARRQRD